MRVHSIARRKQITARPENTPMNTDRIRKNLSSRKVEAKENRDPVAFPSGEMSIPGSSNGACDISMALPPRDFEQEAREPDQCLSGRHTLSAFPAQSGKRDRWCYSRFPRY